MAVRSARAGSSSKRIVKSIGMASSGLGRLKFVTIDCDSFEFGTTATLPPGDLEPGRAPVEVDDLALDAGVELHVVADAHLTGQRHEQPGEQVGQRLLQRQRDGQAADAEGGEHRADLDAELVQDHQQAAGDDDEPDDVAGQARDGHARHRARAVRADEAGGDGGQRER